MPAFAVSWRRKSRPKKERRDEKCRRNAWTVTTHVETVVLLSKPHDFIKITVNTDEMDITPTETKATYREIREYVKKKYNRIVSTLNIAQMKRKYGLEMGKKRPAGHGRVAGTTPEKEEMILDAFKYFQMI